MMGITLMANHNQIPEADRELFRRSVGNVQRIRHDRAIAKKRVTARTSHPANDAQQPAMAPLMKDIGGGDELFFRKPGIQNNVMERLRKGRIAIEEELDLHGMTIMEAQNALQQFLAWCLQNRLRCVRIIHGKGRGSEIRKPVIKIMADLWLRSQPQVLAFCSARASDGGTGAVYVLLRNIK